MTSRDAARYAELAGKIAIVYADTNAAGKYALARLCDEHLDRSGDLLREVRRVASSRRGETDEPR